LAVVAVLGRLSADHQTVLRLRYWDDLSFPQIGERLSRSEDAVRKLWLRALRQLQAELLPGAVTADKCFAESVYDKRR
jgi:RNA polymerase sigma-70 factor (ECF subfamily)